MVETEIRKVITGTEAAQKLGIHRDNVRRLYNAKQLEGYQKGRDLWIYVDSLKEYQRTRKPRGRPQGYTLDEPPKNRATKRKRTYGGRVKSKEEILQDGLKEREKQREWARAYRERQRLKREAEQKAQQQKDAR